MSDIADLAVEIEPFVDHIPRTATELYRAWANLPIEEVYTLNRQRRRQRRRVAHALELLARRGQITRRVITNPDNHRTVVGFYRQREDNMPDPDYTIVIALRDVAEGDVQTLASEIMEAHGEAYDAARGDFTIRAFHKGRFEIDLGETE